MIADRYWQTIKQVLAASLWTAGTNYHDRVYERQTIYSRVTIERDRKTLAVHEVSEHNVTRLVQAWFVFSSICLLDYRIFVLVVVLVNFLFLCARLNYNTNHRIASNFVIFLYLDHMSAISERRLLRVCPTVSTHLPVLFASVLVWCARYMPICCFQIQCV